MAQHGTHCSERRIRRPRSSSDTRRPLIHSDKRALMKNRTPSCFLCFWSSLAAISGALRTAFPRNLGMAALTPFQLEPSTRSHCIQMNESIRSRSLLRVAKRLQNGKVAKLPDVPVALAFNSLLRKHPRGVSSASSASLACGRSECRRYGLCL